MKRLVYHDQDPDGWMSAAVLVKKYPDIELYEVSKSKDHLEILSGYDEVYVVDHSLWNEENLKAVKAQNKELFWIDHHETTIETYDSTYKGLREVGKAACMLTWEFCFPGQPLPQAVFHVSDRDLWNFESNMTEIFANYIGTLDKEHMIPTFVTLLDKKDLEAEYAIGKQIQTYKEVLLEEMYETGVKRDFLGYKAMVFDGDVLRSELMNVALEKNPEIELAVVRRTAFIKDKIEYYKYSLRSRKTDDIDVGELSRKHGGGGHTSAAGIVSQERL